MPLSYVIVPQTTAKTTQALDLTRGPFPKTLHAVGAFAANTIAVNVVTAMSAGNVATAVLPLYDEFGAAVTITATSPPLMVDGPIYLQLVKTDSGAASIGVALVEQGV